MLGFSVKVINGPGHLRVVIPGHVLVLTVCLIWFLLFFFVHKQTTTPRGRRNGVIAMSLAVLVLAFFFSPASVDLDSKTGTARVFTTTFLIPHWRTVPLSDITRAEIHQADFSTAIVLVTKDGKAHQLTPYGQMGGMEEGADAINEFLGASGSSHLF